MLGVAITIITVVAIVFGGIMVSLFGKENTKPRLTMERVRLEFKFGNYEEVIGFSSRDYEKSSIVNVYECLLRDKNSRYSVEEFNCNINNMVVLRVKKRSLSYAELVKQRVFVPTTVTYGHKKELNPNIVYRSFATHSCENYLLFSSDEYTKSSILEVEKYFIKYYKTYHVSWKEYKEDKLILCVAKLEVNEMKTASEMREITNKVIVNATNEILELSSKLVENAAQEGKSELWINDMFGKDDDISKLYHLICELKDKTHFEERLNKLGYTFDYCALGGYEISWE
ncbi:hypothetical protein pwc_47 [Weissella phage PWc]|nr:hypothetical protein pwc_47 [Weissella phage PWc]